MCLPLPSLDEHGALDTPALLSRVLSETGQSSVVWVGHSMGATALFIAADRTPGLGLERMVRAAFLLGPVASLAHTASPPLRLLHSFENVTRVGSL